MKIIFANKYFYIKGGAENSLFVTADLLKKNGHEVAFFSMQDPKNKVSEFSRYFVKNVEYNSALSFFDQVSMATRLLYNFEAKRNFLQLLNDFKPDLVHFHNIYHQLSPSIIHSVKKLKIPLIMTLHDYKLVCGSYSMMAEGRPCEECKNGKYYHCFTKGCVKNSRAKSLLNTLEMYLHHKLLKIYDLIDVCISPSLFLKKKVGEMGFRGKVVHIPNGLKLEDYTPCYDWNERAICYFGRLSHEKGIITLVRAVKGLDVVLKLIGEGPLRPTIEKIILEEKIDNIRFMGFMSGHDLSEEIQKSMFSILPSEWYENNPYSVIESFAFGKPVIGANIGGIPELVLDGKTGYTFESGNVSDLKEKIVKLISNPENIKLFGRNARIGCEKELSADVYYKRIIDLYQSVCKTKCI